MILHVLRHIEDTLSELETDKYIVFGGVGCLN